MLASFREAKRKALKHVTSPSSIFFGALGCCSCFPLDSQCGSVKKLSNHLCRPPFQIPVQGLLFSWFVARSCTSIFKVIIVTHLRIFSGFLVKAFGFVFDIC